MPDPVLKTHTRIETVDLDLTGLNYRIDTGDGPACDPQTAAVSGISISYKRIQERRGAVTEVTDITYRVTGEDCYDSASVHPDLLGDPKAWPDWVRTLVARYRPGP